MSVSDAKILISKTANGIGRIQLNAAKKLNALDTQMLQDIQNALLEWQDDPSVSVILITSTSEKAFCAGGDVKSLVQNYISEGLSAAEKFFTTEYSTDYLIHHYPKPIIVLASGLVLGGGLGLIAGADLKLTSENSTFAMPEISIGLFPDVGAGHFLSRIKGSQGHVLGLTGFRFTGLQAVGLGLFHGAFPEAVLGDIEVDLLRHDWRDPGAFENKKTQILTAATQSTASFSKEELKFLSLWEPDYDVCAKAILEFPATSSRISEAQHFFHSGSPLSRRLIHRQFQKAENLNLRDEFLMEWCMALNCCLHGDFVEGVRAKLIDKTGSPSWSKTNWSTDDVEKFFEWDQGVNGLSARLAEMGL